MTGILSAEESLRRGQELLKSGLETAALEHFANAHRRDPESPRYRSHYGWAVAMIEQRFDRGIALCRSAIQEDSENPEIYLNLARVLLAFGRKGEALRYLRRGLMLDPHHAPLLVEWRRLGVRRDPVLTFLPRGHWLNLCLGWLRMRLTRDWVRRAELVESLR
jgi:tetratricopeptide (TPR) repeat protein